MKVSKKDVEKGQLELKVEVEYKDLEPFMVKGAENLSRELKIEGFRPGKVPLNILKQKLGELAVMEEAVKVFINKETNKIIDENVKDKEVIGQPEVEIIKMAPGNPLEYKIKVAILPDLEMGKYKDLGLKVAKVKVEKKEVNKVLDDLMEMRAKETISSEAIKTGDKVIASVNLFLDKVPVEDGQNPEVTILTGKNYFVEGFDKQVIGLKKGDTKEFSLPYPDNHFQKNLAGKMVEFKVEVKEVYNREIPKVDDDIAKIFQFKSVKDLEENMEKTIASQKSKEEEQKTEVKLLDKLIDGSKFSDIPEVLIKSESLSMMKEIEQGVKSQGGKFEDYLKSIGKTGDELMMDMIPNAGRRVKSALILRELAKVEKIEVKDSEIDKEVEMLKEKYKGDHRALDSISQPAYRNYVENMIMNQKMMSLLKEWNISNENTDSK